MCNASDSCYRSTAAAVVHVSPSCLSLCLSVSLSVLLSHSLNSHNSVLSHNSVTQLSQLPPSHSGLIQQRHCTGTAQRQAHQRVITEYNDSKLQQPICLPVTCNRKLRNEDLVLASPCSHFSHTEHLKFSANQQHKSTRTCRNRQALTGTGKHEPEAKACTECSVKLKATKPAQQWRIGSSK